MNKPKWLQKSEEPKSTRYRSKKQETKIAKQLKGKLTINSGATFGQNDLYNDFCEVEAKLTSKESFSLKLKDWDKLVEKCSTGKIPVIVVEFEGREVSLAVMNFDDFKYLTDQINGTKD